MEFAESCFGASDCVSLQPAAGPGDSRSVAAIGGSNFGDDLREVVAQCALGEAELLRDLGGRASVANALQYLALAVRERVGIGAPCFGGERRIDGTKAGVDTADGFGEF